MEYIKGISDIYNDKLDYLESFFIENGIEITKDIKNKMKKKSINETLQYVTNLENFISNLENFRSFEFLDVLNDLNDEVSSNIRNIEKDIKYIERENDLNIDVDLTSFNDLVGRYIENESKDINYNNKVKMENILENNIKFTFGNYLDFNDWSYNIFNWFQQLDNKKNEDILSKSIFEYILEYYKTMKNEDPNYFANNINNLIEDSCYYKIFSKNLFDIILEDENGSEIIDLLIKNDDTKIIEAILSNNRFDFKQDKLYANILEKLFKNKPEKEKEFELLKKQIFEHVEKVENSEQYIELFKIFIEKEIINYNDMEKYDFKNKIDKVKKDFVKNAYESIYLKGLIKEEENKKDILNKKQKRIFIM